MPSLSWQEKYDLATIIEGYMLQGYTTPSALKRLKVIKDKNLTTTQLQSIIDAVHSRWAKGLDRQTVDQKRAVLVQQNLQNLRTAYMLLASLQQSTSPNAAAEQNRAIANITKILSNIGDLQGLRERTLRVGGDREQLPIRVQEESVLGALVINGTLSEDEAARIDAALIANSGRQGQSEPGGLRLLDAEPAALPAPSGDHRGGPAEDVE